MQLLKAPVVAALGDDIDTDLIYPARYLSLFDGAEVAKHLFEDIDPSFRDKVKNGAVIIAGKNFGCGSAREQAATAMLHGGVTLLVAASYSRSFYRNSINNGLPLLEFAEPTDINAIDVGDVLEIEFAKGLIYNRTKNRTIQCLAPHPFICRLIEAGGICNYYLQNREGYPR